MDTLTAAQIVLSVFLLYAIYSKKSMPLIAKFLFFIWSKVEVNQSRRIKTQGLGGWIFHPAGPFIKKEASDEKIA